MGEAVIQLQSRLDSAHAPELARQILDQAGSDLTLDASELSHMGALCLQVIRSAARSWATAGKTLKITGLSNDCADQVQIMGFSPETLCVWRDS